MKKEIVSLEAQGSLLAGRKMRVLESFLKYKFGFAAFLIPLGIRTIPEILVGSYPIGWDTIAFYVPKTLDWATGRLGWIALLGNAPLLYMISVPVYLVTRVNPVWIFKIMGPVLYGSMILALYRFLRLGLGWTERMSLGGGLMTSLYFVTLRISWDLYRNMLGLTFILTAMILIREQPTSRSRRATLSLLALLAVASDQLTAVLLLGILATVAMRSLVRGQTKPFADLATASIPSLLLLIPALFEYSAIYQNSLIVSQPTIASFNSLTSSLGFLVFAYIPVLPLAVIGFTKISSVEVRSWVLLCVALSSSSLLPFEGFSVVSYRWGLLLDIPICISAFAGIQQLLRKLSIFHIPTFGPKIAPILYVALTASAALYVGLPAQRAFQYFTLFPSFLPSSLLQNTVPLSDMRNLNTTLLWISNNLRADAALVAQEATYGWVRAYWPSLTSHLINRGLSDPTTAIEVAKSDGFASVMMIWWADGSGSQDQPGFRNGSVPVFQSGSFAVYTYEWHVPDNSWIFNLERAVRTYW